MAASQLKEEGNKHFKSGNFDEALSCYTKALDLTADKDKQADKNEVSIYYKNRAACYLKLNNPRLAASDASQALDVTPNDTKALFRRCQAYELLDRKEEAYRDAAMLIQLEPKNKAVIPIMQRLQAYISEKNKQMNSTNNKVSQMFELAFDDKLEDLSKREQALNNLLVLAREESGAELIFKTGGLEKLNLILDLKQQPNLVVAAIRVLSAMCKYSKTRTYAVFGKIGLVRIMAQFSQTHSEICTANRALIQSLLNGITNLEKFKEEKEKYDIQKEKYGVRPGVRFQPLKLEDDEKEHVEMLFTALYKHINSHKLSAEGRDNLLETLINNLTSQDGLNWTRQFVESDGAARLMEVAGMIPGRSTISVSNSTRMHCSVLLNKLWEDTMSDQQRDKIRDMTNEYFAVQFSDKGFDSKLDAVVALSCLLQGPTDLGNAILGREGVMQMLLALADSKEIDHQLIAVEALVHATSKKERCKGIVNTAIPILKHLYKNSSNDNIRVRALVGMCKISSSSGTDASEKDLSEESILALSRACRKFLANPAKNVDLRKWAVEGLAYLTLDGDVKEELVQDPDSLKGLIEIAKIGDQTVLFPAASIFVNLMNAYNKPEIMPEMLKLAEYAQQKVPETHPKDKEDFVKKRIVALMSYDVGSAVVALCKTESQQCKELLSRIFLALAEEAEHRGKLVQQGAGKVLIPLALENTQEGKEKAAQALAKIAITSNPEIAFPGQRILEVIRPLIRLLHPDRTALQTFEALMALTNITSVCPPARKRMLQEGTIPEIETYMLDEHEMLKRAAVECMCNLVIDEKIAEQCCGENDKVKLFTLYCVDEDIEIQKAACGALAILTNQFPKEICDKILEVKTWKDSILAVLVSEKPDVQHRACHLVMNMMNEKSVAEQIVETQLFEVLLAITKQQGPQHKKSIECAEEALKAAATHGFAKSIQT